MLPIRTSDRIPIVYAVWAVFQPIEAGFHVEVYPLFINYSTYVKNLDHGTTQRSMCVL